MHRVREGDVPPAHLEVHQDDDSSGRGAEQVETERSDARRTVEPHALAHGYFHPARGGDEPKQVHQLHRHPRSLPHGGPQPEKRESVRVVGQGADQDRSDDRPVACRSCLTEASAGENSGTATASWKRRRLVEILKSLEDLGFKSSAVEPCLFHGTWRNMQYLVGLYVADIIVSGETESDNEALSRLIDIE